MISAACSVPRSFQGRPRSFHAVTARRRMNARSVSAGTLASVHAWAISWSANLRWYGSLESVVHRSIRPT